MKLTRTDSLYIVSYQGLTLAECRTLTEALALIDTLTN